MTRIAWPWLWTSVATVLAPLIAGCASGNQSPPPPPEVGQPGIAARVLAPHDQGASPAEFVVKPGNSAQPPATPPGSQDLDAGRTVFTLPDAITFALRNSPRLRSARAAIERARGLEEVAFAPFLPQVDYLGQSGVTSATLAPGVPGAEGFLIPSAYGTRTYTQAELGLQWTLYDFGRTAGRHGAAVARERIADLQGARAEQTVEFDVAAAYMDVLLANASCRVQEDSIRRAEAILDDTVARRQAGVALREDVLRAQVQISEGREALVLAREYAFDAVARLNNAMGRNASFPLQVADLETQPPLPGALAELLERAAAQRPEVRLAQQAVAAGQDDWEAARAEFLPRIYMLGAAGHTDAQNVIAGWQKGVGLHIEAPLYAGGKHQGELRSAAADIEAAIAEGQTILDAVSLEVNLAYRGVLASNERIDLSRVAVAQAQENLRLVGIRYHNGNATPTDIVDGEAALTRSQQRFFSAKYTYLVALARLNYTLGRHADPDHGYMAPDVVPDIPARVDARGGEEIPRPPAPAVK